jgi:hypothetical protein
VRTSETQLSTRRIFLSEQLLANVLAIADRSSITSRNDLSYAIRTELIHKNLRFQVHIKAPRVFGKAGEN